MGVCGAFGPERDLSHDDPERRRQGVDYLRGCIDLAAAVGSPHVAGPMYATTGKARMLPPDARAQQFRWAAESIREAADHAGECGVTLAIEPLNRFETDLVNTVEQGLQLCAATGRDNVGLLLDTFHMNIEEKHLGAAVRLAGDRVFHVQVAENDRGTPGSGHVPWAEFFTALDDIDYRGQVVVESFLPSPRASPELGSPTWVAAPGTGNRRYGQCHLRTPNSDARSRTLPGLAIRAQPCSLSCHTVEHCNDPARSRITRTGVPLGRVMTAGFER